MQIPILHKYLDRNIESKIIELANEKKVGTPETGELTKSGGAWLTGITVEDYEGSDISLATLKKMRKHGQVNLALKIVKMPIMGVDWWVECEDKDIADYAENTILKPHWKGLLKNTLAGIDYGMQVSEKVWELQDGHWLYKKIKSVDPTTIELKRDPDTDSFAGFDQEGVKERIKPEKAFVFVNDIDVTGNMYGQSRIAPAYDPWYWATLTYQFYMRYLERRGTPPIKAKAPNAMRKNAAGTLVDCITHMTNIARKLVNDSVVTIPSTVDEKGNPEFDLEYMKDDQRAEQFLKATEHFLALILRYILVPERIFTQSSSSAGSYKMSETHADLFWQMEEGLLSDVLDSFNRYIIPQPIILEFGSSAPPAYIKTAPIRAENKELLTDIASKVIEVTTKAMLDGKEIPEDFQPYMIDMARLLEQLNIPKREEEGQGTKKQLERPAHDTICCATKLEPKDQKRLDAHISSMRNYFQTAEKAFVEDAGVIVDKQAEAMIKKISGILENDRSAKDLRSVEVGYLGEYQSLLSKTVFDAYIFGIKSAKKELGIQDWIPAANEDKQYGLAISEEITNKHAADLKYLIKMTVLGGLKKNRTNADIIFSVREEIKKHKNTHLLNTGRTEVSRALNLGRQLVAQKLI